MGTGKEKIVLRLGNEDFIQDCCNRGERSGSTLNTARASSDLQPRSRVKGFRKWTITKRGHQEWGILAKLTCQDSLLRLG